VSDEDYIRQRLYQAIDALAVSAEPLHLRLEHVDNALAHLPDDYFGNDEDRALFLEIRAVLSDGAYRLDDELAMRLARQIRDLHGRYFPLIPERDVLDEFARRLGLDPLAPWVVEAARAALGSRSGD
jgi:hypothetical protein